MVKENLNLSSESCLELYSIAHTFYSQGKYEDAIHFFRVLSSVQPHEKRNWLGLGASLQMQDDFIEATEAYLLADLVDEKEDPRIPLYAAECYFQLGKIQEGKKALKAAKERNNKNEKFLSQKIEVLDEMWIKNGEGKDGPDRRE